MFVRTLYGLVALAAAAGFSSAQPLNSSFGSRPAEAQPSIPVAYSGTTVKLPSPAKVESTNRAARLLRPVAEQPATPMNASPLPVAVNPAAPPGFNGPCPVYDSGDESEGMGAPGRFWASGQWLFWATSGQPLPVLATAAPAGTDRSLAGVAGLPTTTNLFGGVRANKDFRNGYRLNAGWWCDDCRTCGIEGDFFFLGNSLNRFAAASDGSQILTRPFVNALTGRPDVELVSSPGVVAGAVTSEVRNSLIGGGVNGICNLCGTPCGRLDFLIGYRYWNVSDSVQINENLTALANQTAVPAGTRFQITDRFATSNNFHGGMIGLSGEKQRGRWFVGGRASVALGVNSQTIDISGSTVITPPGGTPTSYPGGLLTQPSNIGHYTRSAFAVVPEVGVRAGAQITEHARVFVGYNFLYMSNVVRAGDQIDLRVNPNQLPPNNGLGGPALPAFTPKTTDFWAQGISLGLELRY